MALWHKRAGNPNWRLKPKTEWADPDVPEYESNVGEGANLAAERKHNIDGAVAATTGEAGKEEGDEHKKALR